MGIETVNGPAEIAGREAEIEEIMAAAMAAARNKPNTPPDNGWGCEGIVGEVVELVTNPYAGTEASRSFIVREPEIDGGFWQTKPA